MGMKPNLTLTAGVWHDFYAVTGFEPGSNIIGAVVGIGDTPSEALEHLKHNAAALKDQPVTVHLESIPALIEEIEEAKAAGKGFKGAILPEPAEAIES